MVKFTYNNTKNISTSHTPFELNCGYHSRMFYKDNIDLYFRLKTAEKLLSELQKLMSICCKNFHYAQELQKRVYNKNTKPISYVLNDKVCLNSKYIKTKQNRKLEAKFFGFFRVLHLIDNKVYKLELPKK